MNSELLIKVRTLENRLENIQSQFETHSISESSPSTQLLDRIDDIARAVGDVGVLCQTIDQKQSETSAQLGLQPINARQSVGYNEGSQSAGDIQPHQLSWATRVCEQDACPPPPTASSSAYDGNFPVLPVGSASTVLATANSGKSKKKSLAASRAITDSTTAGESECDDGLFSVVTNKKRNKKRKVHDSPANAEEGTNEQSTATAEKTVNAKVNSNSQPKPKPIRLIGRQTDSKIKASDSELHKSVFLCKQCC